MTTGDVAGDVTVGEEEGPALISAYATAEEREAEATLRPRRLSEFIAQHRVREQLDLLLQGAMRRGTPPEHILLSGAPGLGKTTLAMIVAAELGAGLRITSGPAIERSGDLAAVLTSLSTGDVLFIDEIHRIARPAEELLYSAMEDFRVDVVVGKGPGATAIPLDVEPFTLVGATTRSGLLTGPMRDRFGFVGHLDFYEPSELEVLLRRSARILGVTLTTAPWRSPAARAALPASPTACCAGCATSPRSGLTAW
jgi:holliday junction DNA helicase RuvB